MASWSFSTFLIVFCSGVIGTCLGTLWSILLCSILVVAGICVAMAGGSPFLLTTVALGPFFSPALGGFAVPIVSSVYSAYVRKNHPTGNGKDIMAPLMQTSWDVLAVGGVTACINWTLFNLFNMVPVLNQCDVLSLVIVISSLLARVLFAKETVFGDKDSIEQFGLLGTNHGEIAWQPSQSKDFPRSLVFAGCAGIVSGGVALAILDAAKPLISAGTMTTTVGNVCAEMACWGFAVLSLLPQFFATPRFNHTPSWHAMCVCAALATMYTSNLAVGAVVGMGTWLVQELMARLIVNHANKSYCDPPASAVAVCIFIVNMLFSPAFLNLGSIF